MERASDGETKRPRLAGDSDYGYQVDSPQRWQRVELTHVPWRDLSGHGSLLDGPGMVGDRVGLVWVVNGQSDDVFVLGKRSWNQPK